MKKKKNKSALQNDAVAAADSRPTSSPYASKSVDVYFSGSDTALKIPKDILSQCSNVSINCDPWGSGSNLHLPSIPKEVVHPLVHFLYTHDYQCLEPSGPSPLDKHISEFTTCIRVYVAARECGFLSLEETAQVEIERLGQSLDWSTVIEVAKNAYPTPSTEDAWFIGYLKTQSKALLTDTLASGKAVLNDTEGTMTVSEVLLVGVLESLENHCLCPAAAGKMIAKETEASVESTTGSNECAATPDTNSVGSGVCPGDTALLGGPNEQTLVDSSLVSTLESVEAGALPPNDNEFTLPTEANNKGKKKKKRQAGQSISAPAFDPEKCDLWEEHMDSEGCSGCIACSNRVHRLAQEIMDRSKVGVPPRLMTNNELRRWAFAN